MALILPEGHPAQRLIEPRAETPSREPPLRVGIVNIMPKLEAYEPSLLAPLGRVAYDVEPVFLRLESHGYQSSDHGHLDRFYAPLSRHARGESGAVLDGLIVTGAPVEELPFEEVHYWSELRDLLAYAREEVACTLGLCWGGMAIGKVLGIEKRSFSRKLFGVFEDRIVAPTADVLGGDAAGASSFVCAHSRHSGVVQEDLARRVAAGEVRELSRGERTGSSVFESSDGRLVAHLGHPEYEGERIAFEWERDRALGRDDVHPPEGFDAAAPSTPWRAHREGLFRGFAARIARTRGA